MYICELEIAEQVEIYRKVKQALVDVGIASGELADAIADAMNSKLADVAYLWE